MKKRISGILEYIKLIFIYGKFGVPALGASGAAIGTVAARIVEMLIIVVWTHRKKERNPFVVGLYRGLHIPKELVRKIFIKGFRIVPSFSILWNNLRNIGINSSLKVW